MFVPRLRFGLVSENLPIALPDTERRMDFERLTMTLQESLAAAQKLAQANGQQQVDVEHFLASLLAQAGRRTTDLLRACGVDHDDLKRRVDEDVRKLPKVSGGSGDSDKIYLSGRLNRVLTRADDEAKKANDQFVAPEHVLLAMCDDDGAAGRLFRQAGLTRDKVVKAMKDVRKGENVNSHDPDATYKALEQFGRDLTQMAATTSSTRSSAATRRSAASSRCCRAAPRTTRC